MTDQEFDKMMIKQINDYPYVHDEKGRVQGRRGPLAINRGEFITGTNKRIVPYWMGGREVSKDVFETKYPKGPAGRMIDPALIKTQPTSIWGKVGKWGGKVMKSPFGRFAGGIGLGYTLNEMLDWRALNDIRTAPKREREERERRLAFDPHEAAHGLDSPAGRGGY